MQLKPENQVELKKKKKNKNREKFNGKISIKTYSLSAWVWLGTTWVDLVWLSV